jgi:hypothetical protein
MSLIQFKKASAKSRAGSRHGAEAGRSGVPRFLGGDKRKASLEREADRAADKAVSGGTLQGGGARQGGDNMSLDRRTRRHMEKHLGADLADVRVHAGAGASSSAQSMNALAYTSGKDVAFAGGQYDPGSKSGQWLLAHELAHVTQQSGGGDSLSAAPAGDVQKYGHKDSCPESFLKSHVWPGDDLARKMIRHALNGLCAAEYGNPTSRNKKAGGQMRAAFGPDWKLIAPQVYNNLWRLRAAFDGGGYMYDCITFGCDSEDEGDAETKYGDSTVRRGPVGGPGGDINLCYKNLEQKGLPWFAVTVIHEMGHLMLGLEHGSDKKSGHCGHDVDDAHCYGVLAQSMWERVDPVYSTSMGDLCHGGGGAETRKPSNWD